MQLASLRRASFSPLAFFALLSLFFSTATAAVLGIDLGTEYIKAALVKPGIPLDIVLTKDSKRKEAAAVAFKPIKEKGSSEEGIFPERLYGGDAVALSARFPGDSFVNIKSLLGILATDQAVAQYKQSYPGATIEAEQVRGTVSLRSQAFESTELPWEVEELLAMQLENIAANAKAVAKSKVKDVVFAIPAYWTSEEKDALRSAAELAGLNVLSLTTDGLAVGLNYATTRTFPVVNDGSKAKPEFHIVYDMGAGGTTATVLQMQGRQIKDVGRLNKTIQEVQVVGVGWDKTLGGDALNTLILNDMITKLADSPKIKSLDVSRDAIAADGRTVSKLWKESERLRQVLSANTESQASFEGIYDEDVSFKYKLKRSEFEKMATKYVQRVQSPIDQALHSARLEFSDIESVIVHGGAQRTPFVQKAIEKAIGKADKVRNNVNADEAAAFGAAFLGAGLSPSFRVKDIRAIEAGIHEVWISWQQEGKSKKQKIFTETSKGGAPKQIPFNMLNDFSFNIFQRVLDGDNMRDIPQWDIETTNLTKAVKELTETHGCPIEDISTEFEITLKPVDNLPEVLQGFVSCEILDDGKKGGIVDGIKGLFGGKKDDQKVLDNASAEEEAPSASEATSTESSATEAPSAPAKSEPKKKTVRVFVGFLNSSTPRKRQVSHMDFRRMQDRLSAFQKSDNDRAKRSEALNQLEAFTYRVRDLLESQEFIAASTEKQRSEISQKSEDASEWLYGDGSDATTEEFERRLKEIKTLVKPIEGRRKENSGRPDEVQSLRATLDSTKDMLNTMKSAAEQAVSDYEKAISAASTQSTATEETSTAADGLDELDDEASSTSATSETPIPSPVITPGDLEPAFKALEAAESWLTEKLAAQDKLTSSDDPVLLVVDLKAQGEKLSKITTDLVTKQVRAAQARLEAERSKSKSKKPSSKTKSKSKTKTSKTKTTTTSSTEATSSPSASSSVRDEL